MTDNDLMTTLLNMRELAEALHSEIFTMANDWDSIPDAERYFVYKLWYAEGASISTVKVLTDLIAALEAQS